MQFMELCVIIASTVFINMSDILNQNWEKSGDKIDFHYKSQCNRCKTSVTQETVCLNLRWGALCPKCFKEVVLIQQAP